LAEQVLRSFDLSLKRLEHIVTEREKLLNGEEIKNVFLFCNLVEEECKLIKDSFVVMRKSSANLIKNISLAQKLKDS